MIRILFKGRDGIVPVVAAQGQSILEAGGAAGLVGACEGSLACTTCHVILPKKLYQQTADTLGTAEEDLLDSAKGVTATSRLGCQLKVSDLFHNATIAMPRTTRNIGEEIRGTSKNTAMESASLE